MKKFEHKNKDERRRVLLSKNNVKSDLSKDNLNTYMSSDAEPRTGAGAVLAKVQGMSRKQLRAILAILVAVAVVLPSLFIFIVKGATTKTPINFDPSTLQYVVTSDNEFEAGKEYYYKDGDKTYTYTFDNIAIKEGDLLTFDPDTKDVTWENSPIYSKVNSNHKAIDASNMVALKNDADGTISLSVNTADGVKFEAGKEYYYKVASTDENGRDNSTYYKFVPQEAFGYFAGDNYSGTPEQAKLARKNNAAKIKDDVIISINKETGTTTVSGDRYTRNTIYAQANSLSPDEIYLVGWGQSGILTLSSSVNQTIKDSYQYNVAGVNTCTFHGNNHKHYVPSKTTSLSAYQYSDNTQEYYADIDTPYPLEDGVFYYLNDGSNDEVFRNSELYAKSFNGQIYTNTTSATSVSGSYLYAFDGSQFSQNKSLGTIANADQASKLYAYDICTEEKWIPGSSILSSNNKSYSHNAGAIWNYNPDSHVLSTAGSAGTTQYRYLDNTLNTLRYMTANTTTNNVILYEKIDSIYSRSAFSSAAQTNEIIVKANKTIEASEVTYSDTMSNGENGLELNKTVSKTNEDGVYKVRLEAYQETPQLTLPQTDIALVFDTSKNMSNNLYSWRYENLATHPMMKAYSMNKIVHDDLCDADFDRNELSWLAEVVGTAFNSLTNNRQYINNKYVADPNAPGTYVYLHQEYHAEHNVSSIISALLNFLGEPWKSLIQTNNFTYYFTSANGDVYKTGTVSEWLGSTGLAVLNHETGSSFGVDYSTIDSLQFTNQRTNGSYTTSTIYKREGVNADNALNSKLDDYGQSTVAGTNLYIRDDYGILCPVTITISDKMYTYEATDSKGKVYRFTTGNKTAKEGYGVFQGLFKVTDGTVDYNNRMMSKTLYYDTGSDSGATYSRLLAEKEAAEDFLYHVYAQGQKGDINLSVTNYDAGANTQYNRAMAPVDTDNYLEIDQIIDGIYNYATSTSNASTIDDGMIDAYNQLNSYPHENRKFAILFSGGVPADYTTNWRGRDNSSATFNTDVADIAVEYSYRIKNDLRGTVFAVGMFENANSAENKTYGTKFYYGNTWLHPPVNCTGRVGSAWGRTGLANLLINGFSLSIDPMDAAATNRMLNYISSDHASASSLGLDRYDGFWRRLNPGNYWFTLGGSGYRITKVASRTDNNHYFGISSMDVEEVYNDDTDETEFVSTHTASAQEIQDMLSDILVELEKQTAVPNTTLTKDASLVDGITGYFDFVGADENSVTATIKRLDGSDPDPADLTDVDLIVSLDNDKKTVTVKGFPYTDFYNKYKIIVEFNVQRREGLIGGNSIPTNLNKSAVYDQDGVMEEQFEIPKVDLPIDMTGKPITLDQATYYASDASLLDTINPYWIDGSNNEFVDITYLIFAKGDDVNPINTYTVLAGDSEGTWTTPATNESTTAATNPQVKDTTEYTVKVHVNARSNDDRLADGKIKDKWYNDNTAIAYVFKPHFDVYNDRVANAGDVYNSTGAYAGTGNEKLTDIPMLFWELTDEVSAEKLAELKEMLAEKREPTVKYDIYTNKSADYDTLVANVTEETVEYETQEDGHTVTKTKRQKTLGNNQAGTYQIDEETDFKVKNVTVTPNPVYYETEQILSKVEYDENGIPISVTPYDLNEQPQTPTYYDSDGNERPGATSADRTVSETEYTRGVVIKSYVRTPDANASQEDKVTFLNTLDNVAHPTETMWEDPSDPENHIAPRRTGEFTISLNSHDVTIINHTVQYDGDPDFSDPTHPFPLTLTLKNGSTLVNNKSYEYELYDADGTKISPANASLTFMNGAATIPNPDNQGHLQDAERIVLKGIDDGYTLTITSILGDNYSVNYQDKTDAQNPVSIDTATTDDDETSATVTINNDKTIDVTHTVHHIVITGRNGISEKVNPFIIAAIVVAVLGGAYVAYIVRRKSQAAE